MHGKFYRRLAKNLWLEMDERGRRLHSYQNIADIIREEAHHRIAKKTVQRWAIEERWDIALQDIKHRGMIKAIMAEREEKEKPYHRTPP